MGPLPLPEVHGPGPGRAAVGAADRVRGAAVTTPEAVAWSFRYLAQLIEQDPSRVDFGSGAWRIAALTAGHAEKFASAFDNVSPEAPFDDLPGPVWCGSLGGVPVAVRGLPDPDGVPVADLAGAAERFGLDFSGDETPRLVEMRDEVAARVNARNAAHDRNGENG